MYSVPHDVSASSEPQPRASVLRTGVQRREWEHCKLLPKNIPLTY